MEFTVRILESLTSLSDAQLDRVTAGSSVFFDRRWFRLLDAMDLAPLVRGELAMRYVVVDRGAEPVAICPFVVTRSKSIYFFYSLEKFFFTSWQAELLRLDPTRAGWIQWVSRIVAAYRSFARATGANTDGWVLAASPLSHRGDIAVAPLSLEDEQQARHAVIDALQDVAKEENLPLCFLGVQENKTSLRDALAQRQFEELFLVYDNLLCVPGESFADYMNLFKSDARRLFNREIKQAREAGVRFEITQGLDCLSDSLAKLYDSTYSKYGEEHFHHPASFWSTLEQFVTPHAEALVAYSGREPVGFSLLLNKQDELWFYRVGRTYDGAVGEAPVYFNLAFYEPVKRAIELGARRIWLGAGAWEAKRRRGAIGHALYSYFWFPRRWSRWVLMPYFKAFTQISREQMAVATQPT
ncbi:MAG: GNAT family N-acetyltransferase, partial [Planctomycetes bacterium]|nr:GNAT family N-acetyltransferase [Planctomycetota bacterium]